MVVGALLVAVLAGIAVAVFVDRSKRVVAPTPGPVGPASTPAATAATKPSAGPTSKAALKPAASGVAADCTAPPATDDAGKPVSYDAGNVLDGDRNTAWRCKGNGDGHTLTFSFPDGTTISTVGLVNGYAKTDPKSGAKRYGEYRRISRVTWTFDNGSSVEQNLADGTQKLQRTSVGPVETQRVTLTIDQSTKPGRSAKSRNAVLISRPSADCVRRAEDPRRRRLSALRPRPVRSAEGRVDVAARGDRVASRAIGWLCRGRASPARR